MQTLGAPLWAVSQSPDACCPERMPSLFPKQPDLGRQPPESTVHDRPATGQIDQRDADRRTWLPSSANARKQSTQPSRAVVDNEPMNTEPLAVILWLLALQLAARRDVRLDLSTWPARRERARA